MEHVLDGQFAKPPELADRRGRGFGPSFLAEIRQAGLGQLEAFFDPVVEDEGDGPGAKRDVAFGRGHLGEGAEAGDVGGELLKVIASKEAHRETQYPGKLLAP